MKTKYFKCTLLSDVIINAQTATEGQQKSLDYIPGANFLGIVAGKLYGDISLEDAFEIFHSGNLRFGNAYLADEGTQCLKVPTAWFHKKGESLSDTLMIHHLMGKEQRKELTQNGVQLKQVRSGFFNPETKQLVKLSKIFNQKSAHDRKNRRSEDGKMFGYESLPEGSEFIFEVSHSEGINIDVICKALKGIKHLGRSKNAQFGLVKIEEFNPPRAEIIDSDKEKRPIEENAQIVIYAKSDLCFFDEYGEPTLQPIPSDLGLEEGGKILWSDSQIRTRSYAPWNGKRRTREADRIVIEKGSVILAEGKIKENAGTSVGSYKTEGLGEIIINPDFLSGKELSDDEKQTLCEKWDVKNFDRNVKWSVLNLCLKKSEPIKRVYKGLEINEAVENNALVFDFLTHRKGELEQGEIIRSVTIKFKAKHQTRYKEISSSQWGEIRNIANHIPLNIEDIKTKLKCEVESFLNHGVASEKWQKNDCYKKLMDAIENNFKSFVPESCELSDENLPTTVALLANQMSKN